MNNELEKSLFSQGDISENERSSAVSLNMGRNSDRDSGFGGLVAPAQVDR